MNRSRREFLHSANLLESMRSDYSATKVDVLNRTRTGLAPMGASADWHIRSEYQLMRMIELARDVDRNDVVVGQGINRLVANVVQEGFPVDPQTGDDEADSILLDKWLAWGEDPRQCHFGQTFTWKEIQRMTLRHTLVDGDIINLLTSGGCIDMIEGHRMRTPMGTKRNVVFGVLKNDKGQPIECWLTKEEIEPQQQIKLVNQITPYPIYDENGHKQVLHAFMPRRSSMTRGISALIACFRTIGLHDDIQYAELVKRQIQSMIVFIRETMPEAGAQLPGTIGDVEVRRDGPSERLVQQLYPGADVVAKPGEKVTGFAPSIQSGDFVAHSLLILMFIAINLDLPVHVFLLDASRTNFSGWRGAIEQARMRWREMQGWLIDNLHRPTYEWKVRQWLTERSKDGQRLRAAAQKGAKMFRHIWHPPGWDYIEPLKDAQADALMQVSLLSSPRRILGKNQLDYFRVVDEAIEDNAYKIRAAIKEAQLIKAETKVEVDWHELIGAALPQGVTLALQAEGDPQEQKTATGADQ